MALLFSLFLIFFPYFTSSFLDLRQEKENEENYQKLLKEQAERLEKIYLTGQFDPATRKDFILIPEEYTLYEAGKGKMYLRKEAYEAYLEMRKAAEANLIDLKIVSATRNFDYQKDIWNKKWNGLTLVDGKKLPESIPNGTERFRKILEFSAVPGTSRHHWGTDIDINGVNPPYFNSDKGKKEYEWLTKNAYLFGFCQTYNLKSNEKQTGYNEEKWHWSYLPLAKIFTQEYKSLIKNEDIKGFLGDEYAPELNLIENYALSINPDCI